MFSECYAVPKARLVSKIKQESKYTQQEAERLVAALIAHYLLPSPGELGPIAQHRGKRSPQN